jgi:proteasome lid subunit RPN8/RPN11
MHGPQGDGEAIREWQEVAVVDEVPVVSAELLQSLPPALLQAVSTESPCAVVLPGRVLQRLETCFAQNLGCEQMALLAGRVFRMSGSAGWLLLVEDVLPVASTHATQIHVAMSRQSWPGLWSLLDASAATTLLGWAHSHPGHGAFFSAEDRRTQALWFTRPWHLGIVLDSVTHAIAGFCGPDSTPVTLSIL